VDELRLIGPLLVAFVLSALIGVEREMRHKSAGLRTHTIVGVGAALFMLISKFGFDDVLQVNLVRLDPSRVAGQVVSGIGFIGAGLIFLRRDFVRGLTSAAVVWLTAAVGMAAGAGLWLAASVAVGLHYFVVFVFPWMLRHVPGSALRPTALRIRYRDGLGILRRLIEEATGHGFSVEGLDVSASDLTAETVDLSMEVRGKGSIRDLITTLHELDGVLAVRVEETDDSII
jgi:putative Mg2+ transporter-C (MgtC) family protein